MSRMTDSANIFFLLSLCYDQIIVKTLFNPQFGMFLYNDQPRTIWFNRNTIDTDNEFFLVGVILGLALYNGNYTIMILFLSNVGGGSVFIFFSLSLSL